MTFNRPYTFELAHQVLTAQRSQQDVETYYAGAEYNGVTRVQLDRAIQTLQRIAPVEFGAWIRQEYIIDGWLHGYLDTSADPTDPALTTWVLGQLADAHYQAAS